MFHILAISALGLFVRHPSYLAVYLVFLIRKNADGVAFPSQRRAVIGEDDSQTVFTPMTINKTTVNLAIKWLIERNALELVPNYVRPQWRDRVKQGAWTEEYLKTVILPADKKAGHRYYRVTGYMRNFRTKVLIPILYDPTIEAYIKAHNDALQPDATVKTLSVLKVQRCTDKTDTPVPIKRTELESVTGRRNKSAAAKGGSDKPPKPQNEVFNAICVHIFKVAVADLGNSEHSGGRVGAVEKAIRTAFYNRYGKGAEAKDFWTPEITSKCALSLELFISWYDAEFDKAAVPRDAEKLTLHYLAFLQDRETKKNAAPAPVVPLDVADDTEAEEARQILKSMRGTR